MGKLFLFFLLVGCGQKVDSPADYSEAKVDQSWEMRPTDCREHIKQALCLTDGPIGSLGRSCSPQSVDYAPIFEETYDNFPPQMQKMFCSMRNIFIERNLTSTAYAIYYRDSNGALQGGAVGFRKSILDHRLDPAKWNSWKEQLSFGAINNQEYLVREDLPQFSFQAPARLDLFIYFVMAHEIGHLFDFANGINASEWFSFSWQSSNRPHPQFDFPGREELCFYNCQSHIPIQQVSKIYEGLAQTNFMGTYAATNPYDDFAEALAYYVVDQYLGAKIILDTRQGAIYDYTKKMYSPVFAQKKEFLDSFLTQSNLNYP